jgi:hypothetical protein
MASSSPRIVFALRQSADWQALAADFQSGKQIDPVRYLPARRVPAFPDHIQQCIAYWNATFRVDFFTCRLELQKIAAATLGNVADGVVVRYDELQQQLPDSNFRLFFLDDDDWFAPDTAARLSVVGQEDVAVFPLLRLDVPVFTFVRQVAPSSPIIGFASRFSHRYQTNNYALHPRLCVPSMLDVLSDHVAASAAADSLGLIDAYHEALVSVTNKTPVAASVIARIAEDQDAFRRDVSAFVATLRNVMLPHHSSWMCEPIRLTADLFARTIGQQ